MEVIPLFRLIRDLAALCRERELQIVFTTHSPYVLDELPLEARAYIMQEQGIRSVVIGVSPEFAMTKMDEQAHHECDLFVEDNRAAAMLREILVAHSKDLVVRCRFISYGAASVGRSLGQMVAAGKFPDPSVVFLDGDQPGATGCVLLPGDDAPERVVFEALGKTNWAGIAERLGRPFASVADACSQAMIGTDQHHAWVLDAATALVVGGDILWHALCAEWAKASIPSEEAKKSSR